MIYRVGVDRRVVGFAMIGYIVDNSYMFKCIGTFRLSCSITIINGGTKIPHHQNNSKIQYIYRRQGGKSDISKDTCM